MSTPFRSLFFQLFMISLLFATSLLLAQGTTLGIIRGVITDQQGGAVSGAKVTVEVDYPDGSSVKATITTGPRGNAAVVRRVTDTGTYTFTVLDVMKPPAVYDALQNVETSDSVTIP